MLLIPKDKSVSSSAHYETSVFLDGNPPQYPVQAELLQKRLLRVEGIYFVHKVHIHEGQEVLFNDN